MKKTKFWKYFFNIFRESKWLLLRYFIVGVYLIVSSIIANRLELNDLTYFNAMVTICYLGEMVAFGFSEGFGIYINQHISEPDRSKKYSKIGLYFTTITASIFAIVLGVFPDFVLRNVLNLDFEVGLYFYYIMLFAMIVMAIHNYLNSILKKVGEFRRQFVATTIESVLMLLGMVLAMFLGWLGLLAIGVVYVIVHILCVLHSNLLLRKCAGYSINMMKFEKFKLTRSEFKVIFERAMAEVVWEVGYIFVSLFILKMDEIIYNQYCFFENSLDIFNGMFFTFVNCVSIKICRCIGEENKEEAKMHARYSMIATFVIWGIYAFVSMSVFVPLRMGMNPELRETALVGIVLYLIIMLFRFFEWNLGTYVLGQSEYFVKGGLILEVASMCYWIILYLIAILLPVNVYLIYALILVENIIKALIELVVYRSNKWLIKSE